MIRDSLKMLVAKMSKFAAAGFQDMALLSFAVPTEFGRAVA